MALPSLAHAATYLASGLATLEGPELRYGFVNVAMQAVVGTEALGRRIEEHPGQLPAALLQQLRPALASGQPVVVPGWPLPTAAGDAAQYVDLRLEPYRLDGAGPVAGLLLLALAVPAPPAPALPLRALQLLLDGLPELTWLASAEGLVEHYNQFTEQYAGLRADELGPTGWVGLLHPHEQLLAAGQWQQGVATGAPFAGQYRIRHQDGPYRWHLLRARPLAGDLPARWFITATDVEEQHRLRQMLFAQYRELAHVHHSLDALTYATNHDLRQPALNLRGLFEELQQAATFHDPEQAHLLHLLDHTLRELDASFYGLSQTVQLPSPEPEEDVVLTQLLEEVLLGLRGLVVQRAAQVELAVATDLVLRGRRASLLAICYNLLSNALQFARPAWSCAASAWPTGRPCLRCRTMAGAWTRRCRCPPSFAFSGGRRRPGRGPAWACTWSSAWSKPPAARLRWKAWRAKAPPLRSRWRGNQRGQLSHSG